MEYRKVGEAYLVRMDPGEEILEQLERFARQEQIQMCIRDRYKLMAFVTSAALAGAAGALYGLNFSSLQASKFDFNTSILILVFVVLGGLGNIWGSLIAAAALTILPEALRQFSDYRMLVYAIVLILVMLLTNNPTLRSVLSRLRPGASKEKEAA